MQLYIEYHKTLPQRITALMILSNSGIDHTQRVSVMAEASPSDENLTDSSTNDDFIAAVAYKENCFCCEAVR